MDLSRRGHNAMASAQSPRITLVLVLFTACFVGVFGRTVGMQTFLPQPINVGTDHGRTTLRTDLLRRWRREVMESHRGRCAELTVPWMEAVGPPGGFAVDFADMFRLRVRSYHPGVSQRVVFPEKSLIGFIRRVYHCCQVRPHCRSVKGIQGHLRSDKNVEFFLTREVLSMDVIQAEIHLQLLNPNGLDIQPSLPFMTKRNLSTRYSLWSKDDAVELTVDLLFLFRDLQEAAGVARGGSSLVNMRRVGVLSSWAPRERPAPQSLQDTSGDLWGDGLGHLLTAQELGLALSCSKGGLGVACGHNGVHLLHTPFIALTYRQ